jgi:hypothetical protein
MSIFSSKTLGTDLYDMPIKAVDIDGITYIRERLEDVIKHYPDFNDDANVLNEYILNKKYWGDFELTQFLLKYINKNSNPKLMKPNLIISVPLDGAEGRFGGIFKRMISEAALSSGWRSVQLMENVFCAAVGAGVPIREHKKTLFMYSNDWCTYICLFLAGALIKFYIIEKPNVEIAAEEIKDSLQTMLLELPDDISKSFKSVKFGSIINSDLYLNWDSSIENKIYMAVPDLNKYRYGAWLDKYQLIYTEKYEDCVVNGLAYAIKEFKYTV